jgi:signal transduction histidine kinase
MAAWATLRPAADAEPRAVAGQAGAPQELPAPLAAVRALRWPPAAPARAALRPPGPAHRVRTRQPRERARRSLIAIVAGGGLALLAALALVAALVASVRRPLDALVAAAGRLAAGDVGARVEEDGPQELRQLARAFNAMAADVQSAGARVEAERRRLATTVRALGDALVITGPDGRIEQRNPRAAALVPDLRPGEVLAEPAPLAAALTREVEVERDGRTLAVTAAALDDDAGHVWTIRDVTERARLERMKTDFLATASHELRSPLTSIKGFVELLGASSGLAGRQREWVGIISVSTDRLVELVNDLLDVTRLEAGQVVIHRRPTDVGALVAEVVQLLEPRVAAKRQELRVDVPEDLPRAIVDPARVRQILVNLLTNAHLYTGQGGRVRVTLAADGDTFVLAVQDTGRGMSPEEAAHVFDRFYRGPERDGPPARGWGWRSCARSSSCTAAPSRCARPRGRARRSRSACPGRSSGRRPHRGRRSARRSAAATCSCSATRTTSGSSSRATR